MILPRFAIACCLLVACAHVAAQGVYRWTDERGQTVFSDRPPPAIEDAERVRVFAGRPEPVPAYSVRIAAERYPVVLYTGLDCGAPCDSAMQLLRGRGVPFEERMVSTETELSVFRERFEGSDVVPAATVGSRTLIGFEPGAWNRLLDNAGYPRTPLPPQ